MKENDNKGFWDRWAKRYDFAMSGDGRQRRKHTAFTSVFPCRMRQTSLMRREPLMRW